MSFEDHWEDYHFRSKCGLTTPQFYREKTFNFNEIKRIALHAYNTGREDAVLTSAMHSDGDNRGIIIPDGKMSDKPENSTYT